MAFHMVVERDDTGRLLTPGFTGHGVKGSGEKDLIPAYIYSGIHRCTFQQCPPFTFMQFKSGGAPQNQRFLVPSH